MTADRFEAALRTARGTGDWSDVIALYLKAAEAEGDPQGTAFYLTHAYIHALEAGDPRVPSLKTRLVALGADVPDPT
ncbi:hypothetical protein [Jannaschia sp. CCS1]|uniref:hypothetical protein n=1 Tax=Jannaschia sp. (strain CCS1) TaxID=290400 RepID=UPI000053DCA6|nr:hypothetical protein [Jannaschia sp. CCS1]ABD54805.1 hypothetical protein Jann_1888 [Jannaschia sp. CCS1]